MGLIDTVKIKVAEAAAADLSRRAERGAFGAFAQKAYIVTKGYKTVIGLAMFLIVSALGQFTPPGYDGYIRGASIAAGVLAAIGWLDKARRNKPVFEPWFLEALASVTAWVSALSAGVLAWAQSGLFGLIWPGDQCLVDQVTLVTTAITTATAFVSRLAKASAAQPQSEPSQGVA